MIKVDKKYDYMELQDIIAEAAAEASESFRDVLSYAKLMSILFQDEKANKEIREKLDAELEESAKLDDEIAKKLKELDEKLTEKFAKDVKEEKEN